MKNTLRSIAGRVYGASPHFLARAAGKAIIFAYHRVLPRADVAATFVQPGMYVTAESFEAHLAFFASRFELRSLADLVALWDAGEWDHAARYAAITFDDGWLDNYRYAYPLLRKYRVPATIFVPTDLVGSDDWLWFDRLGWLLHRRGDGRADDWDASIERAKTLDEGERAQLLAALEAGAGGERPLPRRFVNWDEVREMSRHGVTFGSHTSTHANLTRLTGAALERELRQPLEALRRDGVNAAPILAYPNGDHTDAVVAAARAAGYRAAVTTRPGLESSRPADLFRLRRIGVHDDVAASAAALAFHVARQAWWGVPAAVGA